MKQVQQFRVNIFLRCVYYEYMSKQKRRSASLASYYRWEFLRRNNTYQRSFDQYIKKLRTVPKGQREEFKNEERKRFNIKWGIENPCNYRQKEAVPQIHHFFNPPVDIVGPFLSPKQDLLLPSDLIVKVSGGKKYISCIDLRINFNYSKDRVLSEVERILEKEYEKASFKKIQTQFREGDYKVYLKLWDCCLQFPSRKYGWKHIAKQLGMNTTEEVTSKLEQQYRRCKELINKKGYLYI